MQTTPPIVGFFVQEFLETSHGNRKNFPPKKVDIALTPTKCFLLQENRRQGWSQTLDLGGAKHTLKKF